MKQSCNYGKLLNRVRQESVSSLQAEQKNSPTFNLPSIDIERESLHNNKSWAQQNCRTPTQQNSLTCTVSVQCTALRTVIRKVLIHWDAPMYNIIREPRLPASESYANLICLRHYDSRFLELFLRSGRWRACFLATPSSSASTSAREWRHVM